MKRLKKFSNGHLKYKEKWERNRSVKGDREIDAKVWDNGRRLSRKFDV
jgi:hypothetical protein